MHSGFHIHSLCVVKNEGDIITHCLREASRWSDKIYVFDNGSTDGTWEAVLSCANDRIIPWKQDSCPFRESLRSELFAQFRHLAQPGDWWCRLDADEFYIDDPRAFLGGVGRYEHVVWGVAIEYYLTECDVESIDFNEPIEELLPRLRHYSARNSEPRFVRHRSRLVWNTHETWPRHMGVVHRERIRYRHYKYRTPEQIQKRLETRSSVIADGGDFWWKNQPRSWREAICQARNLSYDDGTGVFDLHVEKMPRHMESPVYRVAKMIAHACGIWH